MGYRPDDGELVGDIRAERQLLRDLKIGSPACNWTVRSTDSTGRIGLQIECFELAWSTKQKQENDALGFGLNIRMFLGLQQFGQRQSKQSGSASLQELSSRDASTNGLCATEDFEHLNTPSNHDWQECSEERINGDRSVRY
jgi:hypothetical protein